jgi:DNA-binding transcriptional ArsR family regulator
MMPSSARAPARAASTSSQDWKRAASVLAATELALAAHITPQTASTHLAKLTEAGLLTADRDGRHRYFRLASPKVVECSKGSWPSPLKTGHDIGLYRAKVVN